MFLFGHLVYATGFMFLISWRGYWQELIETLAWAHEKTPLANLVCGVINLLHYLLFKLV